MSFTAVDNFSRLATKEDTIRDPRLDAINRHRERLACTLATTHKVISIVHLDTVLPLHTTARIPDRPQDLSRDRPRGRLTEKCDSAIGDRQLRRQN